MLDVLKTFDFDYVTETPASTFRGLHESIINYGENKKPELLTCCHEEIAVAMAHGYAKIEGKPLPVLVQSTVGLQHASMALYNAYCDQRPDLHDRRQHGGRHHPRAFVRIAAFGAWTRRSSCAISSNGTISRHRCSISPSPPCAPTRSP